MQLSTAHDPLHESDASVSSVVEAAERQAGSSV